MADGHDVDGSNEELSDGLVLGHELHDGVLEFGVAGDLDMLTSPRLHEYVREAVASSGVRTIVFDLSGVTFLGSSAVTVFIDLARGANDLRVHLVGVRGNWAVERPLEVMGLSGLFDIHDDLPSLRRKLRDA